MDQQDIDKFVSEFDKIGEGSNESPSEELFQSGGGYYQENIPTEPGSYYIVMIKIIGGIIAARAIKFLPVNVIEVISPADIDPELVKRALKWMGFI
jgi:hypothetical protein